MIQGGDLLSISAINVHFLQKWLNRQKIWYDFIKGGIDVVEMIGGSIVDEMEKDNLFEKEKEMKEHYVYALTQIGQFILHCNSSSA